MIRKEKVLLKRSWRWKRSKRAFVRPTCCMWPRMFFLQSNTPRPSSLYSWNMKSVVKFTLQFSFLEHIQWRERSFSDISSRQRYTCLISTDLHAAGSKTSTINPCFRWTHKAVLEPHLSTNPLWMVVFIFCVRCSTLAWKQKKYRFKTPIKPERHRRTCKQKRREV